MSETPVPPLPTTCWPVDVTPECVPHWDATRGSGEDAVPLYTEEQKARAVALAGQSMRMLTAYRVGGCPVVVRPCQAGCTERTWRVYPSGAHPGSTPWWPVQQGGVWLNIGCGHTGGCGCGPIQEVRLHGPVGSIQEVRVDGIVLDPSAYRLDGGGLLVRLDGAAWPTCQDLAAPDTEEGTWSVTYTPGTPVDGLGAWAGGLLAGEYVKACADESCALPASVTTVARGGVTMTLAPGAFPGGRTGIKVVDAYLEAWNPYGHRGPPASVWSPDVHRPRVMARTPDPGIDGGSPSSPGPDVYDGGAP